MEVVKRQKFKPKEHYNSPGYKLLPFKYLHIDSTNELIVGASGDYVIAPIGSVEAIVKRRPISNEKLMRDLHAKHIIIDEYESGGLDVIANRIRTKKDHLLQLSSLHIFVLTLRCNHTCHYCQVSRVTQDKQSFDLKKTDLDHAIELMLKSPSKFITMEFQGGEPLLAFDLLKYAVETTLSLNTDKRINFVICTNGTIYNEEIIKFCLKYDILISTSLDGPEFLHDSNRKLRKGSSYHDVIAGIQYFRNALGKDRISALMTASSLSLKYPQEIINAYLENGFHNIFLRPISPYGFALKSPKKNYYETQQFLEFYEKAFEYILQINLKGTFFREDFASVILKKILTPFQSNYVDLQSPAGAINSVLVYNYDGYVYASDESRMLAEQNDYSFRLGHVSDGYKKLLTSDEALSVFKNSLNEALNGCSDCAVSDFCGADPVFHHAIQGDAYGHRPTSGFCEKNMSIIKYLIRKLEESTSVRNIFYEWISAK
ncbi:MAG: His-Xaa-Ser system radical SAM maturase HxsB [Roseivirga sp.]|nr:His-Xaa-Ser system radical SAM maturase HxsB [Roseivirga sp.]